MKTNLGNMNAQTIKEAFNATGHTPKFGSWLRVENGVVCACAITTFVYHKTGTLPHALNMQNFSKILGLPVEYLDSFTDGYDGHEPSEDTILHVYAVGVQAREAVLGQRLAN